jgi:PAS domain-containing protein
MQSADALLDIYQKRLRYEWFTGEPDAVQAARPVRRGAVGNLLTVESVRRETPRPARRWLPTLLRRSFTGADEVMDEELIARVRETLEAKSTAELRQAHEARDESVWSPEAFEAMRQILAERDEAGFGPASRPPTDRPRTRGERTSVSDALRALVGLLSFLGGFACGVVGLVVAARGLEFPRRGPSLAEAVYLCGGVAGFGVACYVALKR